MKNKLITGLLLISNAMLLNCGGPAKDGNKNDALADAVISGQKYGIDTKQSSITWKGAMLVGTNSHTGYIYISDGALMVEDDKLTGGTAVVDMNTMEDQDHGQDNNLIEHLKSADFFDVEKFPVATMAITKAVPTNSKAINVTGNLTIKGITHPVTFPAKMEFKEGVAKMNGRLAIDRTLWDVRYQSGKFYDLVADQTMSDSIEFHINIIAKE